MKQMMRRLSILAIVLMTGAVPLTAFGQRVTVTKEEFDRETAKALNAAERTFPRRETEIKPRKTEVFTSGSREPVETILNESRIKEFFAKDKIRYELKKVTTTGTTITKRMLIGSKCYELIEGKWTNYGYSCEGGSGSGSGGDVSKKEFFVEKGSLDAKPVKIFRYTETGKVYSDGEPPYIDDDFYYVDFAGRAVKVENLTRRGEGEATLNTSTTYEYDIKIEPIKLPTAGRKPKKRR